MYGGEIELNPGSTLLGGKLGRLVLRDVRLNGERVTGVASWDGRSLSYE